MLQTNPTFQTKEEYAYQTLRQAILRCELGPDEKLVIDRLSKEMGLSQIPVRAAIQRLQAEGLVNIRPHSSATVAPLSPERIVEVFALLENLERTAFQVIAGKVSVDDLAYLDKLIDQMETALADDNYRDWRTTNIAFHRKIAELTAMPLLIDFTNRVLDEWERVSHFYFEHMTDIRLPRAQGEHRQIVALLRSNDVQGLEALAITHNRAANQAYQSLLDKD